MLDEQVLSDLAAGDLGNLLPRSVAEAFDDVEASIVAFESGDLEVPSIGECGAHFNVSFDSEHGYPKHYNTLGPCDDGVSIEVGIVPLDQ